MSSSRRTTYSEPVPTFSSSLPKPKQRRAVFTFSGGGAAVVEWPENILESEAIELNEFIRIVTSSIARTPG